MTTDTRLDAKNLQPLLGIYRDGLLHDTLPFWIPRAIDREHGGYFTSLNEDGTIIHPDKPVWFQGRFAWLLSTLYSTRSAGLNGWSWRGTASTSSTAAASTPMAACSSP